MYYHFGKRINRQFLQSLATETVVFDSGKTWVTCTAMNVKGPGLWIRFRKRLSRGRFVVTTKRIVALVGRYKIIDVPKDHPLLQKLRIDRSTPKRYQVNCDLGDFPAGLTGLLTLSYHLDPTRVP